MSGSWKAVVTSAVVALVIGTGLTVGVIAASASGNPPWEPVANPPEVGSLTFFNAAGQQITGGSTTDQPFAAYIQGSTVLHAGDVKATVLGYTPVDGEAPGAWTGEAISASTTYPNASAPGDLGTSSLPLVTGAAGDESIATYVGDIPNADTSSDGYAGLYVLRVKTSGTSAGVSTSYDSADIQVTGSTWSVVYPTPTLSTTTTTLTTSPTSPQVAGTSVTLTATVSPSAPGTVQFESDGSDIGSPATVTGGTATLSTTALPAGTDNLSAVFTPAQFAAYSGSTGTASYTINSTLNPTTTTLTTTPSSPQAYGTSVTLNAAVTAGVDGSVQFQYGSGTPTPIGTPVPVSGGTASTSTSTLPVGTDQLSAVFTPTTVGYAGSTSTAVPFTVTGIPTATTLTTTPSSPQFAGTSVTLNAAVTAGVDGSIQFGYGSGTPTPIGSPVAVSSGTASLSTTALPVGTDDLSAVFTPTTAGYAGSTGTTTFVINPLTATTVTLTPSLPSPQYVGTSLNFAIAVNPPAAVASGSIQFEVNGSPFGTVIGSSLATSSLPVGTDAITAVFTPTAGSGYTGSTGSVSYTIAAMPTTTSVSVSPASTTYGQPVTYSATVTNIATATPTGSVKFTIGSATLCSATLSVGSGSCVASNAPAGTHTVTGTYSGDGSDATSSGTASVTVVGHTGNGYWLVASDGGIFSGGSAGYFGSGGALRLNAPVVGLAATPDARGYWLAASDGGVLTYGDAGFYGSAGGLSLKQPIVGIAATPDGGGYWLVASDGGVFAFGDAHFYGSAGALRLNKPIVGIATTADGHGYWLVASDGGIFSFGDAHFYGSAGALRLNKPIVGIAATSDGGGYWLAASDGGIFTYGDAHFYGSTGALKLNKAIVGIAATPNGGGYWLVASDGGIFTGGDAAFHGSAAGLDLAEPIVGLADS